MKRVAIYARSSPDCPLTADEQIKHLRTVAIERGWTVAHVFADRPTAVKKGQDRRSGELALIEAIRSGAIDRVLVWSIDRIGKSLVDLVRFMEHMPRSRVCSQSGSTRDLIARPRMDYRCSMSPRILAHHLRQSRRDRILRGQAAARALSIRFGRPPISATKAQRAKRELAAGKGVRQVAKIAGISPASVSRIKTSMSAEATGI